MKYIRTRHDKILDLDTMEFDWALPRENFVKSNAIKQADTIEELCDELVVVFDTRPPKPVVCGYSIAQAKLYAGNTGKIYGAIWTDKGLIYVAKMNKKGELELL